MARPKLFTKPILNRLLRNGAEQASGVDRDRKPVVKLFNPAGAQTWLITEIADDLDTMFGLCDLGLGETELGSVSLHELTSLRLPFGLKIERDMHFTADRTIGQYAEAARAAGRIEA